MSKLVVNYDPPSGKPLGTNGTFKFGVAVVVPLLRAITKRTWVGAENIPTSGPVIVASNHTSYIDVLLFAHFLYSNGRAPRFIGKASIFRVPVIGKILLGAGQVPVEREGPDARKALQHAIAILEAGHMLGIYPEGTLTRDPGTWPMVAKTGLARLAIITKAPVIPVAMWGASKIMPTYEKKIRIFPRTPVTVVAGAPVDFSRWYGRENDQEALVEATAHLMDVLTSMLEEIRREKRPEVTFDPHLSDLPRTGNFKKGKKK